MGTHPAMAQADNNQGEEMKLRQEPVKGQSQTHLVSDDALEMLDRTATNKDGQLSELLEDKEEHAIARSVDDEPSDPREWAEEAIRSLDSDAVDARRRGVVFENLTVSGSGSLLQIQQTVLSTLLAPFTRTAALFSQSKGHKKAILRGFHGLLAGGELLLVLGRPGSGCSTFLKTLCGYLECLDIDPASNIQYKGIPFERMIKDFRGEIVYNHEGDSHFPHLTVGETLEFAAHARAPHTRINDMTRDEYVKTAVQVVMAFFGLSHTYNTKVGNDFVRGVSGGERKRVSIAEMALSRAPIGAWDNSTRGLDAASALDFMQTLRLSADLTGSCHAIAAYQASEPMYNTCNQVVVLYEGREIYFGPCDRAVEYFKQMGWERPVRQVSADFLTAVTNPSERVARVGMEEKVPRTAAEFEAYWKKSPEYVTLQSRIRKYQEDHPVDGQEEARFSVSKCTEQAKHVRRSSPYLLSMPMQIRLCMKRAYQRTRNDLATLIATAIIQVILALVIGSIFYDTPNTSTGLNQKAAVLFLAVLTNALITMLEINLLYSQRPIVDKQKAYAFVHPFAEAFSGVILDIPVKMFRCLLASIVLYFMANLRREPSQFFIYILFQLTSVLTMSGMFRSLAAMTRAVGQAMALVGIVVICIAVYTGFTVPPTDMRPWFGWIRWINPIFYAFESIMSNEFHGRRFACSQFVPDYPWMQGVSFTCSSVGAIAGERSVSGDRFLAQRYEYYYDNIWRNYGILLGFLVFFHILYLVLAELVPGTTPKPESLVFRPGYVPAYLKNNCTDEETGGHTVQPTDTNPAIGLKHLQNRNDVFMWKGLNYEIPVKGGTKKLLDEVDGWVKPGTLTALMGVSGAGKTTLLDVLAQRTTIGVVQGNISVNGKALDASFSRKTGYVQQQDLHLETSTVREALRFSAALRQPKSIPMREKYVFVEEVIEVLGMGDFSEAVIGNPGEGLNTVQRKLLTIGVEIAAKPQLLIFLDEPTSGLDSQSSWAICAFMRKLADSGQAILATIHQPSAMLLGHFDRMLFLAKGGKTVYFGDIGEQSQTLLRYFETNGARPCSPTENPAEYMLEVVGSTASESPLSIDWVETWKKSPQRQDVLAEIEKINQDRSSQTSSVENGSNREFAMPFVVQFYYVTKRVFQQYYRQPEYIMAKFALGIVSGIFIGFSFWKPDSSNQGFQNVLFSLFLLCTTFSTMVNQIMPKFVTQRALYEIRERPSKCYSWKVFILAQMLVEVPWQILLGVCTWASFYFSVYGRNQSPERQGLVLLFVVQFFLFVSSFAQFMVAALPDPALGSSLAGFMFILSLLFNGVMQPPDALPRFWIFMNRISPLTYYVGGISGTALHGRRIHCSPQELNIFHPPAGLTCGQYLADYLVSAAGQLYNPEATQQCQYCALRFADQYLAGRNIYWNDRWRNYGIFCAYFVFNILAAVVLYYLFRVLPYSKKRPKTAKIA